MVNLWWDQDRVAATVSHDFVCRHLLPSETERLANQVGFGDGLTIDTYWDWIETKVQRIFLILVDLGVPDQIFGLIDDSWNDSDLPLEPNQIAQLALTPARDERLERKFFQRQFLYLVRPPQKGLNIVYSDNDIVPVDHLDKKAVVSSAGVDKVTVSNNHDVVFWRRRIPLDVPAGLPSLDFQDAVANMRRFENEHLVSYWGSYIHQNYGYILYTPASDFSLKSFFTTQPACYKNTPKPQRKELVMNWIMCLTDTVAFLHSHNHAHSYIKPSTIHLTKANRVVFFSDTSRLGPEPSHSHGHRSASFDREWYDYAAPEQWFHPAHSHHHPSSPPAWKPFLLSSSPDNFSIQQINLQSPTAMLHSPNPQLAPQAADIFSLGCIILELLSFLLKKQHKFASHRAAKHKTAGRGGAVLDSSFHKNLGQVESWMTDLAKEANKKSSNKDGNHVYRGFIPMLHIVTRMLSANPTDRPAAREIQQRIYEIVTEHCQIAEPHCVHRYDLDLTFDHLTLHPNQLHLQNLPPTAAALYDSLSIRSQQMSTTGGYVPCGSHGHARSNSGGAMSAYSGSTGSGSLTEKEKELAANMNTNLETLRALRGREQRMSMTRGWEMEVAGGGRGRAVADAESDEYVVWEWSLLKS